MFDEKSKKTIESSDYLYLQKLKFRPRLRKTWLNFFVSNFRVVILLMILIIGWGVYSFFTLARESMPEVKIPIAAVITTYPGVAPSDIEELVTKKIETGLAGIQGVDKITSYSSNSVSTIIIQFNADENIEDSIRKLRDQVNSLKTDLPADTNEPIVKEISLDDTPILTMALAGPYDGFTLKKYADKIKDELEKISGVREVNIAGGNEFEFEVAYDPQKLTLYNITAARANQIIAATNLAVPAGSFAGKEFTYPVRGDARFFDIDKLKNVPIFHNNDGAIVYLKDIAAISEKAIERTVYSRFSVNGAKPEEAVTINIVKKTGGNIIETIDQAKEILAEAKQDFPENLNYEIIMDAGERINKDFNQLTHDFILTIILVFGILLLIVGLKEAFVAGIAVPLVFFVAFGVMKALDISLNFLSIFSLILSLGLLVDDAIVVVSATKMYLRTGKFTPEEAVLLVLNDFKVVLTTTTLTTVWAFLPLIFATGIIGSFIKSIPITVSVTLISSLLIALMINHPLAAVLERIRLTKKVFYFFILLALSFSYWMISLNSITGYIFAGLALIVILVMVKWHMLNGKKVLADNAELMAREWDDDDLIKEKLRKLGSDEKEDWITRFIHGIIKFDKALPIYEKYLRLIIEKRRNMIKTVVIISAIFIGSATLLVFGAIKTELFPNADGKVIYMSARASTGLNLDETNIIAAKIEEKLLAYPEIENFSTVVGSGGSNSVLSIGSKSSSNLASITINLTDEKKRNIKSYELAENIRQDMEAIKEATINVEAEKMGPPSGSAFDAQISGDDLQVLDRVANDLKPLLSSILGVVDADISLKDSPAEYTFTLDPARMELYNLNAAYIGSSLRLAISGVEVTTVIKDGKEIKVIARFDKSKLSNLEAVQNLQILNTVNQPVFIKDVAKIELKPSVDTITRVDQKRTVSLTASTNGQVTSNSVLTEFQKKLKAGYNMPNGYDITYGGETEQYTESVYSIIQAMALAGLLIISTLVIQFNSFKRAMIVLVTIPLALIGVFVGLAATGIDLSFPGLIGVLALFGIVVKNAIILIDKINLNLKSGIPFTEAIVDAGKSRLEAIFITSICTIFGMIPITLSNEMWRGLGSAVIFGLILSSFLTLFIVPILFVLLIKKNDVKVCIEEE